MSPEYKFFESEMPHYNYEEKEVLRDGSEGRVDSEAHPIGTGQRIEELTGDLIAAQIRTEELEGTLELAEDEIHRLHQLIGTHLAEFSNESEQALWEAIGGKAI